MDIESYGAYAYAIAFATVLAKAPALGLPGAVLRFIPEYTADKSWKRLRGIVVYSTRLILILGTAFAGGGVLFAIYFRPLSGSASQAPLVLGMMCIPLLALMELQWGILRSTRDILLAYLPARLGQPALVIAGVFLWSQMSASRVTAESALVVTIVGLSLILVVQRISVRWRLPEESSGQAAEYDARSWLHVAFPLLLTGGFTLVILQADLLMLGYLKDAAEAGLYSAASKTAALVGFVLNSVNAIATPTFALYYARGDQEKLKSFVRRCAHLIFWPSAALSCALVLLSGPILGMFGEQFRVSSDALLILVLGYLVNAGAGSVSNLLGMTGHHMAAAKVFSVCVLINLILNVVLIRRFGMVGAAAATTVTTVIWNVWLHYLVAIRLKLYPSILFALKKW